MERLVAKLWELKDEEAMEEVSALASERSIVATTELITVCTAPIISFYSLVNLVPNLSHSN